MALVSHGHRFIYLKTYKTGGTSVEMALQPLCTPPGHPVTEPTPTIISEYGIVGARLFKGDETQLKEGWKNHLAARWIKRKVGNQIWSSYRKITVVRNPFDRMVSAFHFQFSRAGKPPPDSLDVLRQQFRRYILNDKWHDDHKTVFIKGEFVADTVIRFETMRPDLDALFTSFGLTFTDDLLPHTKKTADARKKRTVPEYYDEETRTAVLARLGWMCELFDYPTTPG